MNDPRSLRTVCVFGAILVSVLAFAGREVAFGVAELEAYKTDLDALAAKKK